jgi:hypothetical protein
MLFPAPPYIHAPHPWPSWLHYTKIFFVGNKLWSFTLSNFLRFPLTSSLLRSYIFLEHPQHFFLNTRDQVSHPYKTTRKIIARCVLRIFISDVVRHTSTTYHGIPFLSLWVVLSVMLYLWVPGQYWLFSSNPYPRSIISGAGALCRLSHRTRNVTSRMTSVTVPISSV